MNTLPKSLQNYLIKNKVKFEIIAHRIVYTAFDKSATLRIKPATVGKTVMVMLDKDAVFGLIPADKKLDKKKVLGAFNKLKQKNKQLKYKKIDFVSEKWMKNNIKDIDLGAAPPLGGFYGYAFFIDRILTKQSKVVINGGRYGVSVKLSPAILVKINPGAIVGNFSVKK